MNPIINPDHPLSSPIHLVACLPEIIQVITTFLPNTDLLSCTQVNSTWEQSARPQLLTRLQMKLNQREITKYLETMSIRSNYSKQITLMYNFNPKNCPFFVTLLESFCFVNPYKLTKLRLDLPLSSNVSQYFQHLSLLQNLTMLELRPILSWHQTHEGTFEDYIKIVNQALDELNLIRISFPKVTSLGFYMKLMPLELVGVVTTLVSRTLSLFPNITDLNLGNVLNCVANFVFSRKRQMLSQLQSFRISFGFNELPDIPNISNNFCMMNVTRLSIFANNDSNIINSDLLRLLAPSLEQVDIKFNMLYTIHHHQQLSSLLFPIMPKLKVFRFHPSKIWDYSCWHGFIKFATEVPSSGISINCPIQFPVLRKLDIMCCNTIGGQGDSLLEFVAPYIYSLFLAENNSPCVSLTELDIPIPELEEFKLRLFNGGGGECNALEKSMGFKLMQSWKYLDRIMTIFPNVKYQIFREKWTELRRVSFNKWVQMGVDFANSDGYIN